eukprot:7067559-Pyramimonas_sp.AAC.1
MGEVAIRATAAEAKPAGGLPSGRPPIPKRSRTSLLGPNNVNTSTSEFLLSRTNKGGRGFLYTETWRSFHRFSERASVALRRQNCSIPKT